MVASICGSPVNLAAAGSSGPRAMPKALSTQMVGELPIMEVGWQEYCTAGRPKSTPSCSRFACGHSHRQYAVRASNGRNWATGASAGSPPPGDLAVAAFSIC